MLVFFFQLSNNRSVCLSELIVALGILLKIILENQAFFYLGVKLPFTTLQFCLGIVYLLNHSFQSQV